MAYQNIYSSGIYNLTSHEYCQHFFILSLRCKLRQTNIFQKNVIMVYIAHIFRPFLHSKRSGILRNFKIPWSALMNILIAHLHKGALPTGWASSVQFSVNCFRPRIDITRIHARKTMRSQPFKPCSVHYPDFCDKAHSEAALQARLPYVPNVLPRRLKTNPYLEKKEPQKPNDRSRTRISKHISQTHE